MFITEKMVVSKSTTSKNGKSWTLFKVEGKEPGTVQTFNIFDKKIADLLPSSGTVKVGMEKENGYWVIKEVVGEQAGADSQDTAQPSVASGPFLKLSASDHVRIMEAAVKFSDDVEKVISVYHMLVAEIEAQVAK